MGNKQTKQNKQKETDRCKYTWTLSGPCMNMAELGFDNCQQHRCRYNNCRLTISKFSSFFCDLHKCFVITCGQVREEGVKYCSNHACRVPSCLNSTSNKDKHCEDHRCQFYGCQNQKDEEKMCSKHVCQIPNCQNGVSSNKDKYCSNHVCGVFENKKKCRTGVVGKHTYCRSHRCEVLDCEEQIVVMKNLITSFSDINHYCQKHKCGYSTCSKLVKPIDDTKKTYCLEHKCRIKGCRDVQAAGDICCIFHDDELCQKCHKNQRKTFYITCESCLEKGFGLDINDDNKIYNW